MPYTGLYVLEERYFPRNINLMFLHIERCLEKCFLIIIHLWI